MSERPSASSVSSACQKLMDAYQQAMRQSEQLDPFNRALVRHVVAENSRRVSKRLGSHLGEEALSKTFQDYADGVAADDHVGSMLNFGRAQAKARLGNVASLMALGATIAFAFSFMVNLVKAAAASGASQTVDWAQIIAHLPPVGVILYGLRGTSALGRAYRRALEMLSGSANPADQILQQTVDQPEAQVFALCNAGRPWRPTVKAIGPILSFLLLLGTVLVSLPLIAGIFGAILQPPPNPPPTMTFGPGSLRLFCYPIVFATALTAQKEPSSPGITFPLGTRQLYATTTCIRMQFGMTWRIDWVSNGRLIPGTDHPWTGTNLLPHMYSGLHGPNDGALAGGTYEAVVVVQGQEVQRAVAVIK